MKKSGRDFLITVAGLLLLGIGLYLVKAWEDPQGVMRTLPYICIGIGCGAFGYGMGDIISREARKNYPEITKQIEIDAKDERNLAISMRAKAKAFDMMLYVFAALMTSFALMQVELRAILLLVAAYLFVVGYSVYFLSKYQKEM